MSLRPPPYRPGGSWVWRPADDAHSGYWDWVPDRRAPDGVDVLLAIAILFALALAAVTA